MSHHNHQGHYYQGHSRQAHTHNDFRPHGSVRFERPKNWRSEHDYLQPLFVALIDDLQGFAEHRDTPFPRGHGRSPTPHHVQPPSENGSISFPIGGIDPNVTLANINTPLINEDNIQDVEIEGEDLYNEYIMEEDTVMEDNDLTPEEIEGNINGKTGESVIDSSPV
ncbi:hypothetical protein M422DRAFT_47203 [Sphaerobolus stellatus SS14]|uniref:Uncharacterized protein n=1 Tax=Sphaerobolus stellatus (strain SS14) TaxID=990650 RepID=A0A0C9VCZ3_SPHS4|nr:hypothetical protein M422DRAFT_47203 [Sphaerobolus stellatus SS14]